MDKNIIIKKIERTDKDVDNSVYVIKTPVERDDGNGGTVIIYIDETLPTVTFESDIDDQIEDLQNQINALQAKKLLPQSKDLKIVQGTIEDNRVEKMT